MQAQEARTKRPPYIVEEIQCQKIWGFQRYKGASYRSLLRGRPHIAVELGSEGKIQERESVDPPILTDLRGVGRVVLPAPQPIYLSVHPFYSSCRARLPSMSAHTTRQPVGRLGDLPLNPERRRGWLRQ